MGYLISIKNYGVPHKNTNGEGGSGGVTYITYNNGGGSSGSQRSISTPELLATNGKILKIEGDELNYKFGYIGELESDNIITGKLNADEIEAEKAKINYLDSHDITTEYLTVTKQAHFFELVIDKVRAVGGQVILTPASAALDKVYAYSDAASEHIVENPVVNYQQVHHFNVYWRSENEEGLGVTNDWVVNDQAYCQSFNNVQEGVNHDVSNKYYWRLVEAILPDKMINFATNKIRDVGDVLTGTNNISISMGQSMFEGQANGITWSAEIQEEYMGVSWDNHGSTSDYAVQGIMHTSSTVYGIKIIPTGDNKIRPTDSLSFHIYNNDGNVAQEKMNISVYFIDGTSLFFPNIQFDANFNCILNLGNPDQEIDRIIVYCSQPVQWHKCHGIQLSNTVMDNYKDVKGATPEAGDNIVQLGYRGTEPDADRKRQSAIIISAYMSIDTDLKAPSYAQYIGINDFNLKSHRQSYFDANGATFLGDITLAKYNPNGTAIPGTLQSKFTLTDGAISAEVTRASDAEGVLRGSIKINADAITSEVTRATEEEGKLGTKITQTVEDIKIWVGEQNYADKTFVGTAIETSTEGIHTWVGEQNYVKETLIGTEIIQSKKTIEAWVKTNLQDTGINIEDGTITLQANKTVLQNASGNVTWLSGKVNNETKWDLQIYNSTPWMCFGSYTDMTKTTYITSETIHINTDGTNNKYAELNVKSGQPSLRLYRENKAQIQLYIDSTGTPTLYLCKYMNDSVSNAREAWIYIDDNGRIQFKVKPSSMWVNEHREGGSAVDNYTPYGSLYINNGSTAQLKY